MPQTNLERVGENGFDIFKDNSELNNALMRAAAEGRMTTSAGANGFSPPTKGGTPVSRVLSIELRKKKEGVLAWVNQIGKIALQKGLVSGAR